MFENLVLWNIHVSCYYYSIYQMYVSYILSGLYESVEAFFICCGVLVLVANISVSFGEFSLYHPTVWFLTDLSTAIMM